MPLSWLGFDPTSFLYIGSRRPELQSARFAEHGGSVTLYFDPLPSDTAGDPAATDCARLLAPTTLRLLAHATCSWPTASELLLLLSPASLLAPGDALQLRDGAIGQLGGDRGGADCATSPALCASGSIEVRAPLGDRPPVALISAPEVLAHCDDLELDGSFSGGGSFSLTYSWRIEEVAPLSPLGLGLGLELGSGLGLG